ncbi:ATP-binding protein [Oculatella sp. LEGE 06141]|uniref:ATP-binding protein n=1 Tax=Oculatella sp. LEGE 06141 TaxID=1828648 RepID=UPI0018810CD2|nr:ATP-binding protein [Oculatella sp. LEGE 06141]MBE9179348.1 ATP-binding protein [Oculatella sp. LEGE 06141]
MTLLEEFFKATNPNKTLVYASEQDRQYYIDFSEVRGGRAIEKLKRNIVSQPDLPTCRLFTGHIGCGKSTELHRLEAELGKENFYTIYFSASQGLESLEDVEIGDVLLTIAQIVSKNLEEAKDIKISLQPKGLRDFLEKTAKLLLTEIELNEIGWTLPGGTTSGNANRSGDFSISAGIFKLTGKAKVDRSFRDKLKAYAGAHRTEIVRGINQEILNPAVEQLKRNPNNKAGLAIIIDGLDLLKNPPTQQAQLFLSEELRQLECHVIYTIPLGLIFSNKGNELAQRYGADATVLPMVPVKSRNGDKYSKGMQLMYRLALARAFPIEEKACESKVLIEQLFDCEESLIQLCQVSGGHIRKFLQLLNEWINEDWNLPLSREGLNRVVQHNTNSLLRPIDDNEWSLLLNVYQSKKPGQGDDEKMREYQALIHDMFIYEYYGEDRRSWFDVNPLIIESEEFLEKLGKLKEL